MRPLGLLVSHCKDVQKDQSECSFLVVGVPGPTLDPAFDMIVGLK